MITYYDLGKNRKLHDIVVAGTHDAGITGGGSGVQTQALDIGGQAMAGVRFFDIRVAAAVTSAKHTSGHSVAELRAFHADDKVVMKLDRKVMLKAPLMGNKPVNVTQSKLAGGAFGLSLTSMLQQARNFVSSSVGGNEFLILKFDKCTNWAHIAAACRTTLGRSLYEARGNVNRRSLDELSGKVIVLFSPSGLAELGTDTRGILGFRNLSAKGASYDDGYDGLQYYGKGGTSPFKPKDKLGQNIRKQTKLMDAAAAMQRPEVLGMMYWTTTGLVASIRKRDSGMWDAPNVAKMKTLWGRGLGDYVDTRVSLTAPSPMAMAQQRRQFFPNIVMMDFADDQRCQVIYDLNTLTAGDISGLG